VIVEKDNERDDESRGALVVRAWEYAGRAGTVCERAHIIYIYIHIYIFFFFLAMMWYINRYMLPGWVA
jgi:hypothetical protein